MTKLEKKLQELGYEQNEFTLNYWGKEMENDCRFKKIIYLNNQFTEIKGHKVTPYCAFRTQQDIDDLQQAFKEMQRDLEVLKEYEN